MNKEIVVFGVNEIEKKIFHRYKNPILKKDGNIDNILIANKISSGEKNYERLIGL